MSDQAKGAGHHAITRVAVDRLFELAGGKDKILGHDREGFFRTLDKWQEHADRIVGGDTIHSSASDPGAQRHHSMADPNKTGDENVRLIREFVTERLSDAQGAHRERDYEYEWKCLGDAIHALEDSYSNDHIYRDPHSADDPRAQIEALNNFAPGPNDLPLIGGLFTSKDQQTHGDKVFDQVPLSSGNLERGTDRAAAAAVAEVLSVYVSHVFDEPSQAKEILAQTVGDFFQGENVHVLADKNASEYQTQREAHYQNEVCRVGDTTPHTSPDSTQGGHSSTPANANFTDASGHPTHVSADSSQSGQSTETHAGHSSSDQSSTPDSNVHASPDSTYGGHSSTPANANFTDASGHPTHVSADSSQSGQSTGVHAGHSSSDQSSTPDPSVHVSPDSTHGGHLSTPADANVTNADGHAVHVDVHSVDVGHGTH